MEFFMLTEQRWKTVNTICSNEQLIEVKRLIDEFNGGKNQKNSWNSRSWRLKGKFLSI